MKSFANHYTDIADFIRRIGDAPVIPGIEAGLEGMWFIDACQRSSAEAGQWVER